MSGRSGWRLWLKGASTDGSRTSSSCRATQIVCFLQPGWMVLDVQGTGIDCGLIQSSH